MTTFTATWPYSNIFSPVISRTASPVFVDIDNDGVQDVFFGDITGQVRYFRNTGSNSVPAFVQLDGASNPFNGVDVGRNSTPTFVDIDNDGDRDAFIGEGGGTILYYRNTGSAAAPVFLAQTGASNPLNGIDVGTYSAPAFVDIDNDGDLDAFIGEVGGTILYYRNTGSAAAPAFLSTSGASNPFNGVDVGATSNPTFVDIDNDGDKDAIIGKAAAILDYYKNTGSAAAPVFLVQTGASNLGLNSGGSGVSTFVDIDNDGDQDALIGGVLTFTRYYKNTGSAAAPALLNQTGASNLIASSIDIGYRSIPTFVDVDNDGDKDAFIGSGFNSKIYYYKNTGSAAATAFLSTTGASDPFNGISISYAAPTFVDIDNDGDQDAFIGAGDGTINYYRNTGSAATPTFLAQTGASNPFNGVDVGDYSAPTFVDIDNDGDQDAFIGARDGTILYYKNTGSAAAPVFLAQTGASNPFNGVDVGDYSAPTFVDIDNDGDLDAFIGEVGGTILYYRNTGSAAAPAFLSTSGASNPFNGVTVGGFVVPTFVDIDNDGDQDLVVGDQYGKIFVFLNTSAAAAPPINSVPAAQTATVGTNLVFNTGGGNLISIADIDNTSHEITLTATLGTVTL